MLFATAAAKTSEIKSCGALSRQTLESHFANLQAGARLALLLLL